MRELERKGIRLQAGLTLVELMVAMVISLLLLAGVGTIFLANKESFRLQESLARIQEAGRYSVQAIARDIRRAGYRGCDSGSDHDPTNTLNNPGTWDAAFDKALVGYDADPANWSSPPAPTAFKQAFSGSPLSQSDVIMINFVEPLGLTVTKHPSNSADIQVESGGSVAKGDVLMVTDCRAAAIFQVTNVQVVSPSITNIVHKTGAVAGVSPGNATEDLGKKFVGGEVMRLVNRVYYVAQGAGGQPSLFRSDNGGAGQELVEGVEGLELQYGEDTDQDGAPNVYRTATDVTNWADVVAVRVRLVTRSARDRILSTNTAFSYNGGRLAGSDRRMRKVFNATTAVRNKLL